MNLKTIYNKITGDIHAVSPVVAVLVLIVIAVIGAAAVGVMVGTFTENVAEEGLEADMGITGGSLVVGGSSTVEPVAREIARGFMEANPGVRVTVQTGGTGAGIRAVGMDIIDIGMASRVMDATENATHSALLGRVVQIGNSRVLLVAHPSIPIGNASVSGINNITRQDLHELFINDTLDGAYGQNLSAIGVTRGVARQDRSGTGDEFAGMIGTFGGIAASHDRIHASPNVNVTFANYNPGVFAMIRDTTGAIGGLDIGFATEGAAGVGIRRSTHADLVRVRPLNMITHGEPSRLEQAFLNYARSPGARDHFIRVGVESLHP